jgi:hypothetical protein
MTKRLAALLVTVLLAFLTVPATIAQAQAVTWPRTWILASSSLGNVQSSNSAVAQAAFDNPGTYIEDSYTAADPVPAGWSSVPTVDFTTFLDFDSSDGTITRGFQYVVNHGLFPSWARAILYDPEAGTNWPTNAKEQQDPCMYMGDVALLAASLSQQLGRTLPLIFTPATDLGNAVQHPGQNNQQWFLANNIAGCAAKAGAKIVTVQAQANEFDPASASTCAGNTDQGSYQYYVCNAAEQVHQTPGETVTSGLAACKVETMGPCMIASDTVMHSAAESVPSYSAGFFFYVPQAAPNPENAVDFLQDLGY